MTLLSRSLPFLRVLAVIVATGCTYVPFDSPRQDPVPHPAAQQMPHDPAIGLLTASQGGRSAFFPLTDGTDALGARLSMIEAARTSISLQTFLIKPDKAGGLVSLALIDAANRGVAVRILVDDAFTTASDAQIAYLAAHPRIDVRIFNPLSRRSPTVVNYALDFGRVNRRMHNKAFIVDNEKAIIGGRNIADEYYQIGSSTEFADFDLFVAGPAVPKLSQEFDLFWSDRWSVPVEALNGSGRGIDPDKVHAVLAQKATEGAAGIYRRAINSRYLADVKAGRVKPYYGYAQVLSDPPSKLKQPVRGGDRPLAEALMQRLARARSQVTIVTPYFVPQDWGADLLAGLARKGVKVRIVTNSLAATNHAYVHGGYTRHRMPLLEAGVEIYEIRADAPSIVGDALSGSDIELTMHTKLVIVDDTSFVGSLNFDPRSIKINTEMGVFIDDPDIAREFERRIDEDLSRYTFRLRTAPDGGLIWDWNYDGRREIYRSEPGASTMKKAVAFGASLLPIECQL